MNNIIQTIRHTARAATVLLLALLAAQTAGANDAVTYIDMDGKTKTVTEYTEVTTDMTANENGNINWSTGTYVVKSSVTLNGCIRYSGEVIDLIVCDGATLTVNGNDNGAFAGNTLNIYAQSNGTGMGVVNAKKNTSCSHLNIAGGKVTLDDDGAGYGLYVYSGDANGLTVNGGDVTIQNSDGSQGAIYFNGQGFVTLNGGKLTVTNSKGNGYTAIEGNSGYSTINFNGGTAVINGKIDFIKNINLNGGNVTVNGEIYKKGGYTVTYDFTRATDSYYINAFSNDLYSSATRTVQVKDGAAFLCNGKSYSGTLTDGQIAAISGRKLTPDLSAGLIEKGDTYIISNTTGWGLFCDMLEGGESFSGKTIVLAGDIGTAEDPVTRMGSSTNQFRGTFDGAGHTLTVQYGTASEPVNQQFVAPFPVVEGAATFRNLTIAGSIYVDYTTTDENPQPGVGGLIGHLFGGVTIEGCTSTVEITSTRDRVGGFVGLCEHSVSFTDCVSSAVVHYSSAGNISGFVGWSRASEYTISFEGCLFNGKLLLDNGQWYGGGFVGWKGDGKTVNITNCLYAPPIAADENYESGGATFCSQHDDKKPAVITNGYYTHTLGAAQGKQAHTVTAGTDVTIEAIALTGTATQYTVSGITAYSGGGLQRGETLYYGIDDNVSLTLSNTATGAPQGYQYGYTTNAGTLSGTGNPYTLTMPDQDVTVSVNTEVLVAIPWSGDGTEGSPYIIKYASQLDLLAHRVNGTHGETRQEDGYYNTYFQLNNDIKYTPSDEWNDFDSHESNYEAIGGYYDDDFRYFRGHFDGNNKTISGIRIYKNGTGNVNSYQGIFGQTDGADIHDLTLADARITGYNSTGGIVGYNYGTTVTRCHVADDVAVCAVQYYAGGHGGIVGNNWGTIEQCTSAATLTIADADNSRFYGGIAGINYGTLSDNLAIGATVPAAAANTYGAITGYNDDGSLQRNYYAACKVADTENATGVGCGYIGNGNGGYITADVNNVNNPDGAVCINTLTLAANQAPDGNYWTTYYNSFLGFTIDKNENACAYTATYGDGKLTLHNQGKQIPAGTAVIIVADNDEVSMTATTALDDFTDDNDLHGVDVDTDVDDIRSDLGDGTLYVLGMTTVNNEKHFGFHRYTGSTMAAHKAFALVAGSPSQAPARSLTMVFDEASGIESAEADSSLFTLHSSLSSWFTLDGRRLQAKPTVPGIYVNNGRKVMIK